MAEIPQARAEATREAGAVVMTQQKWAPLVYARTLYVDFRLLAVPAGATHDDLDWLRECIEGSMVYAYEIRSNVRL